MKIELNNKNFLNEFKKSKIIYPEYAFWIFIYAIIFLTIGVSVGEILNNLFPKYDKEKSETRLLLEIYLQVGLIAVISYIFREYADFILKYTFKIEKSPEKFAVLIVAPTMFSQQKELIKKLSHIWDFSKKN